MDARLLNADTIVFDIGNVLLSFDPEKVMTLVPQEHREQLFPAMFDERFLWGQFDHGLESNERIARMIAQTANLPDAWEDVLYVLLHYHEVMGTLPLYDMIDDLRAMGKPVYALTNYPEPSFSLVCDAFPKLKTLDGVVVSAHEKLVKPDPRIFRLLAERFGLTPEKTLFIDDNAANVASAAQLGFQTWHYAGDDRL